MYDFKKLLEGFSDAAYLRVPSSLFARFLLPVSYLVYSNLNIIISERHISIY